MLSTTDTRLKPRRTGPEPRYDLEPLLSRTHKTWDEVGQHVGISRATAHRRYTHGITWSEADDWAIAFGFLPGEVWPEWVDADPATWCDLAALNDGYVDEDERPLEVAA